MPPCVRRIYLAWARRFHYAELFLGHIYLSWKKSPTWNFVAIVGTLGIFLTILLFLVPWEPEPTAQAAVQEARRRKPKELDSKLLAFQSPREDDYPVEFLFAGETQLAEESPRRRRRTVVPDPEPVEDWFTKDNETQEPPRFRWDVEVVTTSRIPRREEFVEDVSWTARTDSFNEAGGDSDWNFDRDDLWQPFDDRRTIGTRDSTWDDAADHQMVGASTSGEPIGDHLQPALLPETAESIVELELELSWNRPSSRRRRSSPPSPQLYLRNLGPQQIPQVDVIAGRLPEVEVFIPLSNSAFAGDDWSMPTPGDDVAAAELTGQTVAALAVGDEQAVIWPGGASRREIVSVMVTSFVGSVTEVAAPVESPRRQPRPEPRFEPVQQPVREPNRPHLKLTIGTPGRLSTDKMVSVPLQVLNDGNVPLDDVVVIADVPATLKHRYGQLVHYRLGRLQPGEARAPTLLMTPLDAGTSSVPLRAMDGRESAEDTGEVRIKVARHEVVVKEAAKNDPRTDDAEKQPERRRRRSRARPE